MICFSRPRILPADIAACGKAICDPDDDTRPHADPHHRASFVFVGV